MVERLLILKNAILNKELENGNQLTKSQSFNTDDDDSLPPDGIQQVEEDSSKTSNSDNNLLKPDESKRNFLLNSPSFDSVNDPEGSVSDIPISDKVKKKKQRRTAEQKESLDLRKSFIKKRPWYMKIDFTKPIMFVAVLFLIYLMWVKRDVWIPRLLTSNPRIRHTAMRNQEKLNEKDDSSQKSLTKDASSLSSEQDDIVNDNNNNSNNNISNNQTSLGDNDEDSPTPSSKSSTPQKLNIRIRRNKMSFSKDRQAKKKHHSRNQILDDEDDADDVADDDDNDDDDDTIDNNDDDMSKSTKAKEHILPSSIHSSKKHHHHHHHRPDPAHEQKSKIATDTKITHSLILRPHDDIIEQMRTLLKFHDQHKDLLTILTKKTGLNKAKINRFIHGKDYSIITLDILISFLNSFNSTLLIVPK